MRDDGLSCGDYLEQLTYLLFLKMAVEQRQLGFERIVPASYDWPALLELKGEALEAHYIAILNHLGGTDDLLAVVFRKAQNRACQVFCVSGSWLVGQMWPASRSG